VSVLLAIALLSSAPAARADQSVGVTADARSIQPGELVVLTMIAQEEVESVSLRALGRESAGFKVEPRTWRALVGIDLDVAPGRYPVSIDARAGPRVTHTTYELAVGAKHFPTRQLQVDEAFVNPPASMKERIDREASQLARVWTGSLTARLWSGPFLLPVSGRAVSVFGTRSVFNGQPRSPHGGADFMSPSGTSIKAPNAGRVVLARNFYYSGNTIVIDHGLGLYSMLAHLSAFDVREGELVGAGGVVGRVGSTGRVTGPHLHWAVRANGARVDPLALLALLGVK